jgi:hypothetical protein
MDNFTEIMLSIYGLAGLVVLIIIIYLIIRRIRISKEEDFEKRDN